jgi:soluble cytochrome b562
MKSSGAVAAAVVWVALVPAGLAACANAEPPAFCQDLDHLAASMQALKQTDVKAEGINGVKTKLQAISQDLDQLSATAKQQFAPQINEVKKQGSELKTTVDAAVKDPSEANVSAARRNVGELRNAFLDLQATLQASC